jgi:hypothetical protein
MCNPTLALAIGAQVAGTVIQNKAYKKADNARNTAIDNNNTKRKGFESEAKVGIDKSKDMFQDDSFDAGNQASQKKFAALYNDSINTPNYAMPKIGNAPAIVEEAMTNEMMKAAAYNKQQGEAKAKLASLGDYLATQVNPQFAKSAEKTAMIGNFMQGESGVLDSELKAAERLAISPTAQILSGVGNAATGAGLRKV